MRKKPNLLPRMERCAHMAVSTPEALRGAWRGMFPGFRELRLELGCGKGKFICEFAAAEPDTLFLGLEKVPDALVVAMERAARENLPNVRFISRDAARLTELFAPGEVSRMYINFCDPWPGKKRAKRRLTSPGFLALYRETLAPGGEIRFKTDNLPLFEYSLETFSQCGFSLSEVTRDLHGGGVAEIMTDYEAKFHAQGVLINRASARIQIDNGQSGVTQ
ncbi:MAG: tRNA (guanosine(46)-N7)-methyltransferase TrmB [Oscillospiraceae bacterium]|jgi:tRNA (guanine-N7-)-methyltransferase|nr:tRNA (guanosine(46)-N7)-methyltransferase TrmB [Oscillospiraceae bacterium]